MVAIAEKAEQIHMIIDRLMIAGPVTFEQIIEEVERSGERANRGLVYGVVLWKVNHNELVRSGDRFNPTFVKA